MGDVMSQPQSLVFGRKPGRQVPASGFRRRGKGASEARRTCSARRDHARGTRRVLVQGSQTMTPATFDLVPQPRILAVQPGIAGAMLIRR